MEQYTLEENSGLEKMERLVVALMRVSPVCVVTTLWSVREALRSGQILRSASPSVSNVGYDDN